MPRKAVLMALLAAGPLGCNGMPKWVAPTSAAAVPAPRNASKQVETQGVMLGERGKGGLTAPLFAQRLATLLQEGRDYSARAYVGRYPDAAAEALKASSSGLSPEGRAFVARVQTAGGRPYEAADQALLQAENLRRGQQLNLAANEWIKAAAMAAAALERDPSVRNPQFWERLATQRQVQVSWPVEVRTSLARAALAAGLPLAESGSEEAILWAVVGCWQLERNDPNDALAAFKRAETLTADPLNRTMLSLWQAKALAALDQGPTALALLVPLADHANPNVAGPALATLGAIKLHEGAVRQGRNWLERANALPGDWSGKTSAQANLALALFFEGDDRLGLEQLHEAEKAFRDKGDAGEWLLALKNESDYWATRGDSPRTQEVRQRMQRIEITGSD